MPSSATRISALQRGAVGDHDGVGLGHAAADHLALGQRPVQAPVIGVVVVDHRGQGQRVRPAPERAQAVHGAVARDRGQPGQQRARRRVIELGPIPEGQIRVLQDLFRQLSIPEPPERGAIDGIRIPVVQLLERARVSPREGRDEPGVAGTGSCGLHRRLRHPSAAVSGSSASPQPGTCRGSPASVPRRQVRLQAGDPVGAHRAPRAPCPPAGPGGRPPPAPPSRPSPGRLNTIDPAAATSTLSKPCSWTPYRSPGPLPQACAVKALGGEPGGQRLRPARRLPRVLIDRIVAEPQARAAGSPGPASGDTLRSPMTTEPTPAPLPVRGRRARRPAPGRGAHRARPPDHARARARTRSCRPRSASTRASRPRFGHAMPAFLRGAADDGSGRPAGHEVGRGRSPATLPWACPRSTARSS